MKASFSPHIQTKFNSDEIMNKISESTTAPSSLVVSPKNYKGVMSEVEKGTKKFKQQMNDQKSRLRNLQKEYRRTNNL